MVHWLTRICSQGWEKLRSAQRAKKKWLRAFLRQGRRKTVTNETILQIKRHKSGYCPSRASTSSSVERLKSPTMVLLRADAASEK